MFMYIYISLYVQSFKHRHCFASFLFLTNNPEISSKPFWGKSFTGKTALLMSNSQMQEIPHFPVQETEAGKGQGQVKGQMQELQSVASTTLAP